jgi:hypothetical protein
VGRPALESCFRHLNPIPSSPGLTGRSSNHWTAIWAQHSFTDGTAITGCPAFGGTTMRLDELSES